MVRRNSKSDVPASFCSASPCVPEPSTLLAGDTAPRRTHYVQPNFAPADNSSALGSCDPHSLAPSGRRVSSPVPVTVLYPELDPQLASIAEHCELVGGGTGNGGYEC